MAMVPARAVAGVGNQVAAGYRGEDVEAFEAYLSDEYGLTAEQYVEICEHAFLINDMEMIEYLHQMDEGIGRFLRGVASHAGVGKHPDEVDKEKMQAGMAAARAGGKLIRSMGVKKIKAANNAGLGIVKAQNEEMESLFSKQLQYSGYTDEYIESKDRN
jgi:hypothetical protein